MKKESRRWAGLVLLWALVNLPLVANSIHHNLVEVQWWDWHNYTLAVERMLDGAPLYGQDARWWYSPVLAWLLVPLVAIGPAAGVALHIGALALLRNRWLIAVVAVSWPWWTDLTAGNLFGPVFVVGALALRGERWAQYAYLAACLLMPRPVQLPLMLWLLWKEPGLRWPFAALFAGHAGLVLLSGYGPAWIGSLLNASSDQIANPHQYAPSRWIGTAWIPIGSLIAAVCLWRGWVGLASLAISPYLIPSYFLAGFWELERARLSQHSAAQHGSVVLGHLGPRRSHQVERGPVRIGGRLGLG